MNKIQHPSNNDVLGAPANWNQGALSCAALAITRAKFGGMEAVVCYWRPSAGELAVINAG
jgi:hypothetical protein